MITGTIFILTLAAALGSALIAGVFFAFSTFVMRALARVAPAHGIVAMQAINTTVLNRWFLGVFVGTAIVCVVFIAHAFFSWRETGSLLRLVGSALYLGGTVFVTRVCNIPRNDALAVVDADSADAAPQWTTFVREWTLWNHVRTIAAAGASAVFMVALG